MCTITEETDYQKISCSPKQAHFSMKNKAQCVKVWKQTMFWEKIFAKDVPDKSLLS